jgi:anti-sigma factor (TIGR02949 family)
MGNCNETIRELDAFLDGELTSDVRQHIHEHLERCLDCLQAFDFQAELKAAIRRKCSNDEMPPGLLGRIEMCFNEDIDGDGIIGRPVERPTD